jgi:hypothetical protein
MQTDNDADVASCRLFASLARLLSALTWPSFFEISYNSHLNPSTTLAHFSRPARISTANMVATTSQLFRFLDLPKELRLMVYERLIAPRLQCIRFKEPRYGNRPRSPDALGYIVRYDPIPPVYLANRTVHAEAALFMRRLARTELAPRIILNPVYENHLAQSVRFIEHLFLLTKETYSRGAIPVEEVQYFGYELNCSETVRLDIIRFCRLISEELFDVDFPVDDLPGVHIVLANNKLLDEDVQEFMSSCAQLKSRLGLGGYLTVLLTVCDFIRPKRKGVEDQGMVHYGGFIDEKTWVGAGFDASVEVRAVITCTPSTRWLKGPNPHPRAQAGTKMRLARWKQEKEEEKRVIEQHKQFLKDVAKGRQLGECHGTTESIQYLTMTSPRYL